MNNDTKMKDQQIVEWIRNGKEQKAYQKLYANFSSIRKMIRENGGNKEDAEDIFQEALIIFSRKCDDPSFVLTSTAGTYLFSVSRFLWSDELRRRGKSLVAVAGAVAEDEFNDVENLIHQEEKFKNAENVLNKIGEKCLQLLKYFYLENKSMKEIAKKMELTSEKIAKNQKYKCLERAKESYRKTLTENATV
jgi:RNA polymerase sigma factor (sigma-70 family)